MHGGTNATSSSVGTHGRAYGAVMLPSQEQPTGVSGGVGALPGDRAESGVALLPDERSQSQSGMGKWEHKDEAAGASGLIAAAATTDTGKNKNPFLSDEKRQTRDLKDPKIGETQVMADRARTVGMEKENKMTDRS